MARRIRGYYIQLWSAEKRENTEISYLHRLEAIMIAKHQEVCRTSGEVPDIQRLVLYTSPLEACKMQW